MVVVITGSGITVLVGTDGSKVTIGNDTVIEGVGDACNGRVCAEATALISSEAVAVMMKVARGFNLKHPDDWDLFFTDLERVEFNNRYICRVPAWVSMYS
jgi:hypothetical protein